jgi:hypothetical protein
MNTPTHLTSLAHTTAEICRFIAHIPNFQSFLFFFLPNTSGLALWKNIRSTTGTGQHEIVGGWGLGWQIIIHGRTYAVTNFLYCF